MVRIRIHFKLSDPDTYQIEKKDPDPDEKKDPDPDQKGLDLQHWLIWYVTIQYSKPMSC